jgi:hypothetical protein
MDPEKRSPSGRERRAHPRASCEGTLTLELADGPHRARLRDVSRAGISFFLDRPVAEMTVLAVRIELPPRRARPAERIEGRGVVVRSRPIAPALDHYEIAVFLSEMSEAQRATLDGFVTSSANAAS